MKPAIRPTHGSRRSGTLCPGRPDSPSDPLPPLGRVGGRFSPVALLFDPAAGTGDVAGLADPRTAHPGPIAGDQLRTTGVDGPAVEQGEGDATLRDPALQALRYSPQGGSV